jgi:triacylglycerol lipase
MSAPPAFAGVPQYMQLDDAQFALRTLDAELMLDPTTLTPPASMMLTAAGWRILGYLTGIDAVLKLRQNIVGERRFYGFLAQSMFNKTVYLVAVRGTETFIEWLKDLEGAPVPHPLAGRVHAGFNDIYRSFQFKVPLELTERPLIDGLREYITPGSTVVVAGHSLGSPLGQFTTLDLVRAAPDVTVHGRYFASPRAGDQDFAAYFGSQVRDYRCYYYPADLVPKVPLGFGYVPLPMQCPVGAHWRLGDEPPDWHHAFCYACQLDPSIYTAAQTIPAYKPYLASILGPV